MVARGQIVYYQVGPGAELPALVTDAGDGTTVSVRPLANSVASVHDESAVPAVGTWHLGSSSGSSPSAPSSTAVNGEAVALPAGTPVVYTAAGVVGRADAGIKTRAQVVALLASAAAAGGAASLASSGIVTLPATTWDAPTGQVGGLTPLARYYLALGGGISTTPPSAPGQTLAPLGVARSATELDIRIGTSVLM